MRMRASCPPGGGTVQTTAKHVSMLMLRRNQEVDLVTSRTDKIFYISGYTIGLSLYKPYAYKSELFRDNLY